MDKWKIALIVVLAIGLAIILGVFLKKKKESPLTLENCKKDFPCAVCGTPLSQENCSRNFPCTVCGTPLNRENCMSTFPCSTGTSCPSCPSCPNPTPCPSCPNPTPIPTPAVIRPRATSIGDCGYQNRERGWYDVSNNGARNDYCRWIGNNNVFSCKLAGSSNEYEYEIEGTKFKDYSSRINEPHDPLEHGQTNCM